MMKVIQLADVEVIAAARSAAATLRGGGVVLYPTDTLYGLGADALSDEAVAKVKRIKERDEGKPIHCIVADMAMVEKYSDVSLYGRALADSFWPGPLTLVCKKKAHVGSGIAKGIDTIGIRIPQNDFCLALARELGRPYTTTSANIAGMEAASTIDGILEQLGTTADEIDLVIDAGALAPNKPSTVVDTSGENPQILREGAIPRAKILEILENAGQ